MPSQKHTVITTSFNESALYVSDYFKRPDGQVAVTLTSRKEEAYCFETKSAAETIREKILNPFDRTYTVESILMEASSKTIFQDEKFI